MDVQCSNKGSTGTYILRQGVFGVCCYQRIHRPRHWSELRVWKHLRRLICYPIGYLILSLRNICIFAVINNRTIIEGIICWGENTFRELLLAIRSKLDVDYFFFFINKLRAFLSKPLATTTSRKILFSINAIFWVTL